MREETLSLIYKYKGDVRVPQVFSRTFFSNITLLQCSGRLCEWIWRCEDWCVIVGISSVCCFVQIGKCSLGVQPTFRGRLVRSCSVDKVFTQQCMGRWRKKNGLYPVVGRLEYGMLYLRSVIGSIYWRHFFWQSAKHHVLPVSVAHRFVNRYFRYKSKRWSIKSLS
jgi:hypothetical protein